jgi:hypothetical protein
MSCGPASAATRAQSLDLSTQAVVQGSVARAGAPAVGAYVRLLDAAGEFVAEVRTGRGGDFRFFAAPGDWTLRVLAAHASAVDEAVTAQRGEITEVAVDI